MMETNLQLADRGRNRLRGDKNDERWECEGEQSQVHPWVGRRLGVHVVLLSTYVPSTRTAVIDLIEA
jgi:hypothetical protein